MLTKEQMKTLKTELVRLQKELNVTEENTTSEETQQEVVGELSTYDNHPADMGTELYDREKDRALNEHATEELEKVQLALEKMEDGSYGVCEQCGIEIPFERLEAVPYTTVCVDHAEQTIPEDRPVEDDLLKMANPNTFADRRHRIYKDPIDSFEEIAKSGTSETPSDFVGDHDNYETLYESNVDEGGTEEIDVIAASNIAGEPTGVVIGQAEEEYEEELNEKGLESELGDIPYRETDSYVDK